MSRAAFFDALAENPYLNSLGIQDDLNDDGRPTILQNYSSEERPSDETPFIILRWNGTPPPRSQDPDVVAKSPESLTLWVHWPQELSADYNDLNKILDEVDDICRGLRDRAGNDGYTLSFVQIGGRSGDFLDDGFQTITKNAAYELHSRRS